MAVIRGPFQGIVNIIRFNWHFYLIAICVLIFTGLIKKILPSSIEIFVCVGIFGTWITLLSSLLFSHYIYDHSDLYELNWLKIETHKEKSSILNISAGFDEISDIVISKSNRIVLSIADFYDPEKHTEVSIKRARKLHPPPAETISIKTHSLPFEDQSFDKTIAFLSAHEIRDDEERIIFFQELKRVTKASGEIIITEHLRDFNNFLAYTIGFFHFHSRKTWLSCFAEVGLKINEEIKSTPFITTFVLRHDGNSF